MLDPESPPKLYRGEDKDVLFWLSKDDTGKPFDLAGATEIDVVFPKEGSPICIHKKLSLSQVTVINEGGGGISVALTAADTVLMPVGIISIEGHITIGGKVSFVQFPDAIEVVDTLFPGC